MGGEKWFCSWEAEDFKWKCSVFQLTADKQCRAASQASLFSAGRFKPNDTSLSRQATEHGATATIGRPRSESSLTSYSTSTKTSKPSLMFSEDTFSLGKDPSVEGTSDDAVKVKDD